MRVTRMETTDLQRVRSDFPALENYTWFQNGGVSITPRPVAEFHAGLMDELLQRGPMHIVYPDEEYPRRKRSLARLAEFFGVSSSTLAVMRGVSEAFLTVLRGLDWQPGDEIVVSADEEAALLLPVLALRDQQGITVRKLELVDGSTDQQVAALEACRGERTRLVAFSHVTTDLGYRLPAGELCETVRQHGAMSFVDMAHSCGVLPIDLDETGCDFAGLLSYKWMYSPYAAGLLYVNPGRIGELAVRFPGGRSESWLDFETDRFELHDSAERFQFGPWSWPLVHAWAAACDWLTAIGPAEIAERTGWLTDRLKPGLQSIETVELLTPGEFTRSAALVSMSMTGWTGEDLAATLRERWNMIVKPLPHTREGLRISVPFFLLEEEIDRLVEALGELATCS